MYMSPQKERSTRMCVSGYVFVLVCVNVFLNNVFFICFLPSILFLCLFIIHLSFCLSPLSLSFSQCFSLSVSLPSPSLFHSVFFPLNISLTPTHARALPRVSIICILRPTSRVEGGSYRGLYKAILGPRAVGAHGGLRVFLRWIRSEVGSNMNTHRPHFIFAVLFY